jgi:hypothetical protein
MVYGLLRALLGDHRLVATVIGGIASTDLTPASERQNHTASPSASMLFVGPRNRALQLRHVHRIPRPTFVTIAKRPS